MSSWYVFSAIGLYPDIPGVGGFVLGSPLFTSATVQLAGGHTLQINAPNAADGNPYVQSLDSQWRGHDQSLAAVEQRAQRRDAGLHVRQQRVELGYQCR